ncbi:MAG: NHLP leader peptide family RiPP precursor [Verrucomicrobiota bacterium]
MASGKSTAKELSDYIVNKAARDDAFRQKLIANPNAAISTELAVAFPQVKIPAGVKINVVEQSADNVYIVLPPKPRAKSDELSDVELDVVAGGYGVSGCMGYNTTSC